MNHIHDGRERLENFVTNIKDQDIDFIIQLGDFCVPMEENKFLLQMLHSTGKPCYHVIGNHDSDLYLREEAMNFFEMDSSFYCFKKGKIKFIVLDTCFIDNGNEYEAYQKKNYDKTKDIYPVLPDNQLKWLEEQLDDDSQYYVIYSHHSLENEFAKRSVHNRAEVRTLINKVNASGKRMLLCVNGHDHGDSLVKIEQTYYFGLNSMSY